MPAPATAPVHVIGAATTAFAAEHDAMLDELVFDVTHRALSECGLGKADIGVSVTASMDVLDGRSISNGLTTSASGGYLTDSFRVEGDMGVAIVCAAQAISSGDKDVAVAVGVHNPEVRHADGAGERFLQQVSNLAFEPHADRPVGMTAEATYGMHAARRVAMRATTVDELAESAAAAINRGSTGAHAYRRETTSTEAVLASSPVCWPLRSLMLPAWCAGAVAVVLAAPARASRCVGRDVRLIGYASATGPYTHDPGWLHEPWRATRQAAVRAYRQAGLTDSSTLRVAEISLPTTALADEYRQALAVGPATAVNASGGLHASYPGLANGGLRLVEVIDRLGAAGDTGVAHSVDTTTGLIAQDVSVLVAEAI